MITATHLRNLMTAKPFKPFRVHMSDGSKHDITNHDMAFVERNTFDVGIDRDEQGFAEDIVRCSILHIVKLEDISRVAPPDATIQTA